MICFAIDDPISFENVEARVGISRGPLTLLFRIQLTIQWYPEIQRHGYSGLPFLVVGLKADLRTGSRTDVVMRKQVCISLFVPLLLVY
jgi:hypothetical protein